MSRGASAQPGPPSDLTAFPAVALPVGTTVFRSVTVNGASGDPWAYGHFANDAGGRFNVPSPRGTMSVARSQLTAIMERIGAVEPLPTKASGPTGLAAGSVVNERFIDEASASKVFVYTLRVATARSRIANLHHADANMKYSVTGELGDGADIYPVSQAWAAALDAAGFDGIQYHTRFDTRRDDEALGYALFGDETDTVGGLDQIGDPTALTKLAAGVGLKLIRKTPPTRLVSALPTALP